MLRILTSLFVLLLNTAGATQAIPRALGQVVHRLSPGCENKLQRAPRGPFAVLSSCEDALGNYLSVVYLQPMGVPIDGAWEIGDRTWHDAAWGDDVTSFVWSSDGERLFIATESVYGTGAVYALSLQSKQWKRLTEASEASEAAEVGYSIVRLDESGGRLHVLLREAQLESAVELKVDVGSNRAQRGVRP